MHFSVIRWFNIILGVALLFSVKAIADVPVIELWPNGAPGEQGNLGSPREITTGGGAQSDAGSISRGEEKDTTKPSDHLVAGKRLIRLGNVSKPTISIYRPAADKDTGAAVLVCPGGAYSILAMDLEGTEVCEWLNSIGVTGVLLKYRVPKREGIERHAAALQDAQRGMGLIRQNAAAWKLDPKRIGVLGFSAGGHLAAAASCNYERRTYSPVDDADAQSCRPDFSVLVYPAYLTVKTNADRVAPELPITTNTPPTFITISTDDPVRVENAMFYSLALKEAKVPVELHVYAQGGHGYGLRRTEQPVTTWPDRLTDWMRSRGLLERK